MKKWLLALALSAGLVSTGNAAYINRLKTFTGVASQWPWQLNADGTWTLKQPQFSDLSSTAVQLFGATNTWSASQTFGSSSNWPLSLYDIALVGSINAVDTRGVGAIVSASRSSDNTGAISPLTITNVCSATSDNTSTGVPVWCNYWQGWKTATAVSAPLYLLEASIQNLGVVATADPYVDNAADRTEVLRPDCGIGSGSPNNCTAAMHVLNNGAAFRDGIIFGSTSLDTAAGRIPSAVSMAQNQALSWFSAAGNAAWKIYSNATGGNNTLLLENADAKLSTPLIVNSSVNATTLGTGAISTPGGLSVSGQGYFGGTLTLVGFSSGKATITQQSVQGTPTLTLPTTTGTFAVAATTPLALDAATGVLTCSTCLEGGGAASLTTLAASGVVSFTDTTEATALGAAAVILSGGLSVAKQSYFGEGSFWCNNTCGLGFRDSAGTPHTNIFVSAADETVVKIGKTGGTLKLQNSVFSTYFAMTEAGAVTLSGGVTASALPTSAGAGGLYVCVDTSGVLYKKASCP